MSNYISISNTSLMLSLSLMFVVIIISILNKLNIIGSILLGTVRSFVQLTFMGYVLSLIFDLQKWYFTITILLIMLIFATMDSYKRIDFRFDPVCKKKGIFKKNLSSCYPKTFRYCLLSMVLGNLLPLAFIFYLVLNVSPWYNPQYIIPISAMIISNTMTAISLFLNTFGNQIKLRLLEVEAKLSLGSSPAGAINLIKNNSIKSGLIPTINTLMVLGIVKLPGMMTGQILGGVDPIESVRYQLLIMYTIAASTALSLFILAYLTEKALFNHREQIKYELLNF